MGQKHVRIAKYRHLVERIRKISGAPGLAIGIIHNGDIVHEDYQGYRDVEARLPVNRDTIFSVASLTKAITAILVAILVTSGKLHWDTPLEQILPFFKENPSEKSKLSVIDLLSHRSGTTWGDALYLQSNNNVMLPKSESLPTFRYLPTITEPRSQFLYNNHACSIAGFIIEELSQKSYGNFLKEKLFDPLKMTRSFTKAPKDENVAAPYSILSNGSPFRIPFSEASADTIMFASISVRTSMADALRLYQATLESLRPLLPVESVNKKSGMRIFRGWCGLDTMPKLRQKTTNHETHQKSNSATLPIEHPIQLFRPYITRNADSIYEQTTALGWNRTQLPGKLEFGWNSSNVSSMPLFGNSFPEKLVFWHGGNLPGTTAAVILFPETSTAVVVMHNSLGLCDAADLIAQLLSDCLFTGGPQHDYVSLAEEATKNGLARMEKVAEQLRNERKLGTKHRPLGEYVGQYENSIKNWMIEIGLDDFGQLFLRFQGRIDEQYPLRHYHYDVFVWNLSYDETVKRAQYCRPHAFYQFHFESQNEKFYQLRWHHDPNMREGEVFLRRG